MQALLKTPAEKAQAMKSKTDSQKRKPLKEQPEAPENDISVEVDSTAENDDFGELEDSELEQPEEGDDESKWEVFLFDDESAPIPDYGDFWLPD
jgi:hypothetical protein